MVYEGAPGYGPLDIVNVVDPPWATTYMIDPEANEQMRAIEKNAKSNLRLETETFRLLDIINIFSGFSYLEFAIN